MKDTELKAYSEIFTAAWKLFKKYSDIDGSVEAYRLMKDEAQRNIEDFSQTDHDFAEGIFVAVCSAVQRVDLERRGKLDRNKG